MENSTKEQLNIPNHVAIIPDGNRRWAKNKGLPTFMGHKKGFDTANDVIKKSRELGVHTITLWAFSTENWNRSKEEIDYLMKLYESNIEDNLKEAKKTETKIIHLGRKDRIPNSLKEKIIKAEEETKDFNKHVLNVALDYGGHDELLRASERLILDIKTNKITIEDTKKEIGKYKNKYPYYMFKNYLDTKDQPYPYPDLLIRTSGEQRLSGFLSWQIAYTELYFTDLHMPDFGPEELVKAIEFYSTRNRRFGGN
jgi:undecaprenyl diphosphate synthase